MPVQNTFTLIPQFPGRANTPERGQTPIRPMTSKQVQKAYKAANRAPRMSRAEQRKQEKAEQERIRKEFEKEKAAAKAKAVREKKKAKEAAEREVKKKKGLPTVTVNPSQDTIAWFVRGKKRDSGGKEMKTVGTLEPIGEMPPPPVPSPKKVEMNEMEEELEDDLDMSMPAKKRLSIEPEMQPIETSKLVEELPLPRIPPPIASPPRAEPDDLDEALEDIELETFEERDSAGREDMTPGLAKPMEDTRPPLSPTPWTMELDDLDDVFQDDIDADVTRKIKSSEGGLAKGFEASKSSEKEPQLSKMNARKGEMSMPNKELGGDTNLKITHNPGSSCRGAGMANPLKRAQKKLSQSTPPWAELSPDFSDELDDIDEDFLREMTADLVEVARESIAKRGSWRTKPAEASKQMVNPGQVTQEDLLSRNDLHELEALHPEEDFDNDYEIFMEQSLEAMMEGRLPRNFEEFEDEYQDPRRSSPTSKTTSQVPPMSSRPRNRIEEDLGLQIPVEPQPSFKVPPKPQRRPSSSPPPPSQPPPLSTQAIFLNFDDFFPSPSQQVRELEEEKVLTQPTPVRPRERVPLEVKQVPERHPEPESEVEVEPEPEPQPNSPSPPKGRFFTSSGSHEMLALAMQRSRRTAALEELHQKERSRLEAGMIAKAEADERAKHNQKMRNASVVAKTTKGPTKSKAPTFLAKRGQTIETARTPTFLAKRNQAAITGVNKPAKARAPATKQSGPDIPLENNKENVFPDDPSASQETEYGGDWVDEIALELMI
ncbi:Fc.00g001220.m01.CDS01 [Cosmosporella sp. VM-42]